MSGIDDGGRLADAIAAHLPLKLEQKQQMLEMGDVAKRLEHLLASSRARSTSCSREAHRGRVKRQMEKSQREYYLNEQSRRSRRTRRGRRERDLDEMEKKIRPPGCRRRPRPRRSRS